LIDVHTHIVGVGTNGSGCYINSKMNAALTHPYATQPQRLPAVQPFAHAALRALTHAVCTVSLLLIGVAFAGSRRNSSSPYVEQHARRPFAAAVLSDADTLFIVLCAPCQACGVTGAEADCDLKYAELLANLVRHCSFAPSAPHGRSYILAFDQFYTEEGVADPARTGFHVPNEWSDSDRCTRELRLCALHC
jgi:hypothetical protein